MWLAARAICALEAQRREATFANPYIGRLHPASLMNLHDVPLLAAQQQYIPSLDNRNSARLTLDQSGDTFQGAGHINEFRSASAETARSREECAVETPSLGYLRLGLGALAITAGCGESDPLGRRPVSGTVTLDGQPLADGTVSFQPTGEGTTSSGAVIAAGKYAIARDRGLPQGKYRVVINAIKPGTGMTLPAGKMPGEEVGTPQVELIPAEWNTKSQHVVEVSSAGAANFTHEIVTKKK